MHADDIPLHDIKPLIVIHDYTPYYLAAAAAAVFALLLLVGYLLFKRLRSGGGEKRRRERLKALKGIDLDADPKAAAYAITEQGRFFAGDSPRLEEAYLSLARRLEPYKFRKTVPPIDENTRAYFRIYIGMIDV